MFKNLKNWWAQIKKEVKSDSRFYFLLGLVIIGAFLVRVWRLDQLLGFYYDQGRDAMVIWKLWHDGNLFLIGPVTGLEGIFLGPAFYYLIAPFYLLGGGSPIWPSVFLCFLATLAVLMLYILGWKFHSKTAGFIAASLGGFSYFIVYASRWLSNPTPILLTSVLLLWSLWKIATGCSRNWWIVAAFMVGISLQFESASAIFYIPTILIFALWKKDKFPPLKTIVVCIGLFLATLVPQLVFDLIHGNILSKNVLHTFFKQDSFKLSFGEVLEQRKHYFWDAFSTKLFAGQQQYSYTFLILLSGILIRFWRTLNKNTGLGILIIMLVVPLVGLTAFQGNHGNIYGYYLTGVFLPFILLIAILLAQTWKISYGKVVVIAFFIAFFWVNGKLLFYGLQAGVDGPTHITLGNQMQSVDWVFKNAATTHQEFNVDVYVPPVIPHTYDYLFLWQGTKRCGGNLCSLVLDRQVPLLYTLYEVDPPHPERLKAWMDRQAGIGKVEEEVKFGGITVQRRTRINE